MEATAHPDLPRPLELIRRALAAIGRVEMAVAAGALFVVVVLSTAQAFLRYLFGTSLYWAQEVAETMVLLTYFLGIAYVYKTRQDIIIDFLAVKFPLRLQMVCFLLAQLAALGFTVLTVVLVLQFWPRALGMQTPVLRLPGPVTLVPIGLGAALMAVTSAYYLAFGLWAMGRGGLSATQAGTEDRGAILPPVVETDF